MKFLVYGILALFLGTGLVYAAPTSEKEKPITQELKPGEKPLEDQGKDGIIIYSVPTKVTCMTKEDGDNFVKYSMLQPYFVAKSNNQAFLVMVNPVNKTWAIMIVPEPGKQTMICIAGGGTGFAINPDGAKETNETK